jgi:hypothetical protein
MLNDPLVEIVPGSAIGNLVLESLPHRESLTDKQNKVAHRFWNERCKVTNVARSASVKRPIVWVEVSGDFGEGWLS